MPLLSKHSVLLLFLLLVPATQGLLPLPAAARPRPRSVAAPTALRMGDEASSRSGGPHGSNSGDTLTRQGFIGGLIGAALAPALVKPGPPPSYDVIKYERIFDTARKSFVPADPSRLIFPGVGFADRVVCTGEMHTHPLHHRMQFEVIKAVASVTKAKTEPLAIGLEMFYRQQQVCGGICSVLPLSPLPEVLPRNHAADELPCCCFVAYSPLLLFWPMDLAPP